jgi:hypothetical protein
MKWIDIRTRGLRNPRTGDVLIVNVFDVYRVMRVIFKAPNTEEGGIAILAIRKVEEMPRGNRFTVHRLPYLPNAKAMITGRTDDKVKKPKVQQAL